MGFKKEDEVPMGQALKMENRTSTLQSEPPSEVLTVPRSPGSSNNPHDEKHSDYGNIIRDVIIGFADGLTVPFALTAGLSSWVPSSFTFLLSLSLPS